MGQTDWRRQELNSKTHTSANKEKGNTPRTLPITFLPPALKSKLIFIIVHIINKKYTRQQKHADTTTTNPHDNNIAAVAAKTTDSRVLYEHISRNQSMYVCSVASAQHFTATETEHLWVLGMHDDDGVAPPWPTDRRIEAD